MTTTYATILILIILLFAAIRLLPHPVSRLHQPVEGAQDKNGSASALRVLSGDTDAILAVHDAMMEEPRTRVISGNPQSGSATYVSRSRLFGFPDYITVEQTGRLLKVFSRSRWGKSDLGVNARRLDRVLARAGLR